MCDADAAVVGRLRGLMHGRSVPPDHTPNDAGIFAAQSGVKEPL